jgi:hypothetical protein
MADIKSPSLQLYQPVHNKEPNFELNLNIDQSHLSDKLMLKSIHSPKPESTLG